MDREVAEQKEKLRDLYEDNQPTFLECVERLKPIKNTHIENDTRNK
ncbi:hypothetical protein [Macrococcus animalis]